MKKEIKLDEKTQLLLNELNDVLNDPEVKNNQELTNAIIPYKIKLEHGEEYKLTCTKLGGAITFYLDTNKFKAPKSVINLYNNIVHAENKYRGVLSFFNWF